jgi:Domain of unknown function (DUF4124)
VRTMRYLAFGVRRLILPLVAMALVCTSAAAEVVYKLGDRQGHIIYSDRVIPGTKVMGKLKVPPPPDPGLVAAAQAAQAERVQYADRYAEQQIKAMNAADARIRQAQQRLAAATRSMEAGTEPLPGERIGTVRVGFSQFSEAYWIRLTGLEREVAQATKALEEAYSERNALRD